MKGIVFLGNRRCEVREVPVPEPGDGEIQIRVKATGICGSDLHVYRRTTATDQVRGHEPCGVVEGVGPNVKRLKPGDRVSVHHHLGCGVCPMCARGETVACPDDRCVGVSVPGSFAEFTVAAERNCILLPDAVSFTDGAFMACVGTTAYAALRRLEVTAHESLAVFGLGPVGLSCVLVAKALGLRVVGMDGVPERLELALACGADEVVDGRAADPVAALQAFSRVPGIDWINGVDHLIETSGSAPARRCMLPAIRRGGKIAIVGVGSDEVILNPSHIHGKAATLIGSVVFPLGWSWEFVRFLATSGMSFEPAVTHRFALDDAQEALRIADEARGGKVVFLPNGE